MFKRASISKGLRFKILTRDRFCCKYCGRRPPHVELHIDHILPVSRGGTNDERNLCAACTDCNLSKHDSPVIAQRIDDDDLIDLPELGRNVLPPLSLEEEDFLFDSMRELNRRRRLDPDPGEEFLAEIWRDIPECDPITGEYYYA